MTTSTAQPDENASKVAALTQELRAAGERLAAVNDCEVADKDQVRDAGPRAAASESGSEADMAELIAHQIGEITKSAHYERVHLDIRMRELTAEIERLTIAKGVV